MSETNQLKRFQCRHILTNGHQCRAVCLRGEEFCYFHHTTRRPIQDPAARKGRRSAFTLPLVEDRASIQLAIAQILCRIATNDIDPRRAGLLLYGLQTASLNLPKEPSTTRTEDHESTIEEIVQHPEHGPIAPETDLATRPRSGPKDLEQILMEDWAREEAREAEHAARLQQADDLTLQTAEEIILNTLQAVAETPLVSGPKARPIPAWGEAPGLVDAMPLSAEGATCRFDEFAPYLMENCSRRSASAQTESAAPAPTSARAVATKARCRWH